MAQKEQQIYEQMDYQAVVCGLVRQSIIQLCSNKSLIDVQIELINKFKAMMKQMCALTTSEFQTDQMAYLGQAFLGVVKHFIFRAQFFSDYNNPIVDYINWFKITLNKMPVDCFFKQFNPLIFDLSELASGTVSAEICEMDEVNGFTYPETVELTRAECLSKDVVLLDDGLSISLVICRYEPAVVNQLFR